MNSLKAEDLVRMVRYPEPLPTGTIVYRGEGVDTKAKIPTERASPRNYMPDFLRNFFCKHRGNAWRNGHLTPVGCNDKAFVHKWMDSSRDARGHAMMNLKPTFVGRRGLGFE